MPTQVLAYAEAQGSKGQSCVREPYKAAKTQSPRYILAALLLEPVVTGWLGLCADSSGSYLHGVRHRYLAAETTNAMAAAETAGDECDKSGAICATRTHTHTHVVAGFGAW